MELFVHEILRLKILAQDYHSDDDVSAISDSDSDILVTVEKADIIEFLDDDSSTLAGFEEEYIIDNLHIAPEVNFRRETAERIFVYFTRPNKRVSPVKSSIFSIIKKTEVPFFSFSPDPILYPDDV